MTFMVAVSGKGGTGKTTFSALTVDYLVKNTGKAVLAVDADSNANLDLAMGTEAGKTVGSIREYLTDNISRMPAGMSKEVWVETLMQQALVEEKGFDLLSMGRPEGPGCYCYLNNIFRRYLDIMSGHYQYVVADNEAGMEHLSRRTTRGWTSCSLPRIPRLGCADRAFHKGPGQRAQTGHKAHGPRGHQGSRWIARKPAGDSGGSKPGGGGRHPRG